MIEILIAFLIEVVCTVGVIAAGGLLIALCNRAFYSNVGSGARAVCYVTGVIGTPVHELSHALFCVIFGHKIEEIKLFQINSEDGTLGYVRHSYNPKNVYQKIGNFFIGIGPILVISGLLYLGAYLLIPSTVEAVSTGIHAINGQGGISGAFGVLVDTFKAFFGAAVTLRWWIFVVVGAFFALHMNLSVPDIKGALSGLVFLLLVLLVLNVVLRLIGKSLIYGAIRVAISCGIYLTLFLSIALIINLILLGLSFLLRFSKKRR